MGQQNYYGVKPKDYSGWVVCENAKKAYEVITGLDFCMQVGEFVDELKTIDRSEIREFTFVDIGGYEEIWQIKIMQMTAKEFETLKEHNGW